MTRTRILFGLLCACGTAALSAPLEFNRDIRPILSDRCYPCHGPDNANRKTAMRLDREQSAKSPLKNGKVPIVAGKPQESLLYERIVTDKKALRMPPAYSGHDRMPDREIEIIKRWIEEGAAFQDHWSFIPPRKASVPGGERAIDHFVNARLKREGLSMSAPASRAALIRRVSLDLTGLPPTPAEVDAFVADQ